MAITKEELAAKLSGREIDNEIDRHETKVAKESGLVVVFGASDDLMEFRGAVDDEESCYGGGEVAFTKEGLLVSECDQGEGCPYFRKIAKNATKVTALWCKEKDGPSWTYATTIPHSTFTIMEDGEPYCRGIVFALADVA